MLRWAALLVLLVLTWTQEARSGLCGGDKCDTKEHQELHSILEKTEAAVSNILQSVEHKKILQDVTNQIKSKICDLNLDAKALSKITKKYEYMLKRIKEGKIDEKAIVKFLTNEPMKHLDSFLQKIQKTPNN